ncbi:hypothetical protein BH10PSE11_BH10PSE11_40270 [soil metagenome]
MCAQVHVQEGRAFLAGGRSAKAVRLALLFGSLLTVSIAVNAMIIFATVYR